MDTTSVKYGILLLEKPGRERPIRLADGLARATGLVRIDVLTQLRLPYSFIMPYLDEDKAKNAASYLVANGVAAIAQPLSALDIPHGSGTIRNADPKPEGFLVQNIDNKEETLLPWKVLRGAFIAHRMAAPAKKICLDMPSAGRTGMSDGGEWSGALGGAFLPMSGAGFGAAITGSILNAIGKVLTRTVFQSGALFSSEETGALPKAVEKAAMSQSALSSGQEDDVLYLIMGENPAVISVIERGAFKYDYLGERLALSGKQNFQLLVNDICQYAKPLYVTNDVVEMIKKKGAPKEKVPGAKAERWVLERVLALNLYEKGLVPSEVTAAIGDDESLVIYLE